MKLEVKDGSLGGWVEGGWVEGGIEFDSDQPSEATGVRLALAGCN